MIKRVVIAAGLFMIVMGGFAQGHMPNRVNTYSDEGPGTGFLKQNLFIGGSLALGYGGNTFNVGVNPEIGYSLNKWLDAGLVVNLNYTSERADPNGIYNDNTRYRSFNYGAGLFGRFWPLPFLFLQAQPEYNFVNYNQKYMGPGGGSYSQTTNAPSLLMGAGYGQRIVGEGIFYLSLSFDVLNSQYSPYRNFNGAVLPVIRAGFDFYLHPRR